MMNPLTSVGYVYGLRHKDSDVYFYVGCSRYDPQSRFDAHIYQVKTGTHSNAHFVNTVKKFGAENVTFDILEEMEAVRRFDVERQWIDKLKADGHKLVNRIHNGLEFHQHSYRTYQLSHDRWLKALDMVSSPPPRARRKDLQELSDMTHAILCDLVKIAYELEIYPFLREETTALATA